MNVTYIFMDFQSLCEIFDLFLCSSLGLFSFYTGNDCRIDFCGNF